MRRSLKTHSECLGQHDPLSTIAASQAHLWRPGPGNGDAVLIIRAREAQHTKSIGESPSPSQPFARESSARLRTIYADNCPRLRTRTRKVKDALEACCPTCFRLARSDWLAEGRPLRLLATTRGAQSSRRDVKSGAKRSYRFVGAEWWECLAQWRWQWPLLASGFERIPATRRCRGATVYLVEHWYRFSAGHAGRCPPPCSYR